MSTDHDSYDKQYIAAHAEVHTPPITLDDEVPRFGVLPHHKTDLWEETAFALVAACGDHDVLMWTAGYLLKGNGRGVWIDEQAAEHDIMFIAVPRSQRGTMTDNPFARSGWQPTERLPFDAVKVERGADRVLGQFDEHRFVSQPQAQPPQWRAEGRIAGLELDLTYRQASPPLWNWGSFPSAAQTQRAGYDVFAR